VIMDFMAIWALTRSHTVNILAVCIGDAFSSLLSYFQETRHDLFYDYKFHFALPITVVIILVTPFLLLRRANLATGIALIGVGMCHIWLDSRTAGAVCILVGFVLIARDMTRSRLRSLYLSLLALALILSSTAIALIYTATDSSFAERREGSNSYRFSAAMAGIDAIKRSPIVGLGSWVWDPEMWNIFSARMGRANIGSSSAGDTIGPHSQIIQAWAEAGLLGLFFFVYFGWLLGKALWVLCFRRTVDWMTPLFLCYLLLAVWDLCFSPFANLHRFLIALTLAMAIHVLSQRANRSHG
jgi:O-antigen ligase